MSGELLLAERFGAVRRLTLNRPDRRNALSLELLRELVAGLEEATDDRDTSVVVLRGAGKGFSAGYDLSGGGRVLDVWSDRERLRRTNRALEELFNTPLPVIAQVHGFALAGGADLALHCDMLVCAEDARIGFPPVRNLGVPPTNMWLYRLGPQLAKRLLLTGDSVTGSEAHQLGLAIDSWPTEALDEKVLALAKRMAQMGREMLIGNKHVLNRGIDLMGRATLSRIAETEDAVAHLSEAAHRFRARVADIGLHAALRERDAAFQPDPPGIFRHPAP